MRDYWPGSGCGLQDHFRQEPTEMVKRRQKFLRKWQSHKNSQKANRLERYPFIHRWFGETPGDPLIVPICLKLIQIGAQTIASCQGSYHNAPYITFYAKDIIPVYNLINEWRSKLQGKIRYWDNIILSFYYFNAEEDLRPEWMIQFYDTFSVIKFTKEILGISVEEQFVLSEAKESSHFNKESPDFLKNLKKYRKYLAKCQEKQEDYLAIWLPEIKEILEENWQ